jgi:hypothetical protein
MTTTGRPLLLMLQAGHEPSKAYLVECVRANGGNIQTTAEALGIGRASLYRALSRDRDLAKRVGEHAAGLDGSRAAAVASRRKKAAAKKSTAAKKKSKRSA